MFLEVKANKKNSGYAYIRRSVRDGSRVKAKIIEYLGSIELLQQNNPNIIEELKQLCKQGSIEPFKSRILNHDIKLRLAINSMSGSTQPESNDLNYYRLLDKAKTTLNHDEQLSVLSVYASNYEDYQGTIDKIKCNKALFNQNHNTLLKDLSYCDYELPPFDCYLPHGLIDAVVVAAGVGSRMGANMPKQYLTLGDRCVLEQTVMKLLCCPYIQRVIVVIGEHDPYFKNTCLSDLQGVTTVWGGKERVDSVINGLKEVNTKYCLVHDAARPLFLMHDIEQLIIQVAQSLIKGYCGGILCSKVADTLKLAHNNDLKAHAIYKTIDRSHMYRAQTPQLFETNQLIDAITKGLQQHQSLTDEASALEFLGQQVLLVEGSALNFKLTDKSDMLMANAIWNFI